MTSGCGFVAVLCVIPPSSTRHYPCRAACHDWPPRPLEFGPDRLRHGVNEMTRLHTLALALTVVLSPVMTKAEQVTGAGSSFAYPIITKWSQGYRAAVADGGDYQSVDSGVDYEPVGSTGGVASVIQGTVDFGATDSPLSPEELQRQGLGQFPIVMGGIVPIVNLAGIRSGELRFTGSMLADIYLGKIKTWDDPAIKAVNPDVKLPGTDIKVVHRSDGSGTTFNWTNYLSKTSAEWKERIGHDTSVRWATGTGAKGTDGVVRMVKDVASSIGYVEFSQVHKEKLIYALVQNRAGNFIPPNVSTFQAAATTAEWSKTRDFYLILTDAPGEQAYPIVATTFALMPKEPKSIAGSRRALDYFRVSLEKGGREASDLGYVPLPETLVDQVKRYWTGTFKVGW